MSINVDYNQTLFGFLFFSILIMLGLGLIRLTWSHKDSISIQSKLFLAAFGIRFAASIAIYEFGLVKVLGDDDSSGWIVGKYLADAWEYKQIGLTGLLPAFLESYEQHHKGYQYMLGVLFSIIGTAGRIPAAAFNGFLGAITVVLVYRIARTLFSNWTATRAAWLACVFPSMIIWSAQTLKEPVIIFLESLALYACVNLKLSGFKTRYVFLCVFAILLLPPFRFYAAYIAGAAALGALLLPQIGKRKSSMQAGVAIAALVIPLVISTGILARNEAQVEKFSTLQDIRDFKVAVASGQGSGVDEKYDLNSSSGLALAITVGAAHLLLAPFPWQLGGASLRMALTAPELIVWWWLVFVGLLPGAWYAIKNKFSEIQPMLFFIVGLGLLYSMMFGNVGLIFRQRAQLLPWLLILAVVGLEQRAIKKLFKRGAVAPPQRPVAAPVQQPFPVRN